MEFQAFWTEMWARCGPAHMGFEQCEAARDVYEKAKAKIEAAEREKHEQWKRELRQMAQDAADDRGDVFAQRVLRALGA